MRKTWTVAGGERAPVDSVAARVTAPGIEYVSNKQLHQDLWEAPPPTAPVPEGMEALTDTRRGRMRIIGYLWRVEESKKHKWLARCDCGRFELRDGSMWRRGMRLGAWDGCQRCQHAIFVRRREEFDRTGTWNDETSERLRTPVPPPLSYWGLAALRKHFHRPCRLMGAGTNIGRGERELIAEGFLATLPDDPSLFTVSSLGRIALERAESDEAP